MKFFAIGTAWLAGAIMFGASGALGAMPPPVPQLIILALTAGLVLAAKLKGDFAVWLREVDLRLVIGLHLSRFVGFYFLHLYGQGELPYAFAVPGGWGDIVVAVLASGILLGWSYFARHRGWLRLWNVVGLVDILAVVITAGRCATADPGSMAALLRLPLSLLPTFLVPLIVASHLLVFQRLRAARL